MDDIGCINIVTQTRKMPPFRKKHFLAVSNTSGDLRTRGECDFDNLISHLKLYTINHGMN